MTELNAMSARNKDSMLWKKNRNWYAVDRKNQRFVLTEKAPEEARRSFEKYKRINKLDWND